MVAGFRRNLSLSIPNPSSPGRLPKLLSPEKSTYHVRSTSLPAHSHPIISRVEDEIRALRSWQSKPECSAWLRDGLAHLDHLLAALDDLLRLPDSQGSFCKGSERLLDDLLGLVDAHGTFRSIIMDLKQHHSAAQVAIRARDDVTLASSLRSLRSLEKDLGRTAASLRNIQARSPLFASSGSVSNSMEAEMAGILREVAMTAVSALTSVFLGISAASAAASAVAACYSSCSSPTRASWMVGALRRLPSSSPRCRTVKEERDEEGTWRRMALRSLEGMEKCIGEMESESGRVFRSLINTRVSLLNMLTPCL